MGRAFSNTRAASPARLVAARPLPGCQAGVPEQPPRGAALTPGRRAVGSPAFTLTLDFVPLRGAKAWYQQAPAQVAFPPQQSGWSSPAFVAHAHTSRAHTHTHTQEAKCLNYA